MATNIKKLSICQHNVDKIQTECYNVTNNSLNEILGGVFTMITAKQALERTEANSKELKWNIFDTIQLKHIELKIKFWSGIGKDYIYFGYIRPLVRDKLEKNNFEIENFDGDKKITWWRG